MEQHLKCPRCNSLDTKFCYNNNRNKNQPRYLCRTCERHWTQGGSLRDIPIGGGHRKAKCTTTSAPSSTSIVQPPPQSLQQEVVQNQLVSPPVNPISQPFNQSLNDGAVNDVHSFNRWVSSLPISVNYHQGSGDGAGAWYLSALAGDHSLSPSSQVSFNQSQNDSNVNGLSSRFNLLLSPSLPINNTYHHRSAGGGAQDGYLSSLAGVQSLNASSQISFNQPLNGGGVNELASPSLPITNTYHHGSASGGAQDGYLSSLAVVQPVSASSQVSFNQSLNGGGVNEFLTPSLPITNTYHHGSASRGAQDGYLSSLAGFQSVNASSHVSSNNSLNGGGVNELVSPFNEMVSPSLPITNTYHHGSDGVEAQDGYLSSLSGLQPMNASSQVSFNQSLNGGSVNELISPFNELTIHSLPITDTYHHGSASGGVQDGYFSSLPVVHPMNASSQVSFDQSLNGGGVNEFVTPSLPITNAYHHGSAIRGAQDGYLSSLAGVQSVNASAQVSSNLSLNGGGVNELVSHFNEMVNPSIPITNTYHHGSDGVGAQDGYLSSLARVQPMNASSQVSFNQSLNGGGVNEFVTPSLPIANTYHHDSASLGAQDGYLSSSLAGVQSVNASAQVSSNLSLNGGGVNELVSPFNKMVSPSLPITNTYHHVSDGVGVQDGYLSSLAGLQPMNASSQVSFNQSMNGGSVNELISPFNELTINSLPITDTYHHGSLVGGAQAGYFSSLARVQSLDPSSHASNQSLNGVVGSSDLALLSGFNVADSHASASQHGIESQYEGVIQPSLVDDSVATAFHYPDRWPQNFINSDNNVNSDDIDITSNINGNSDQNIFMPNHGSGLPGYGAPPQY